MNVSILISSFNRLKYFVRTWESIKPQLEYGDELIVVEDGTEKGWLNFLVSAQVKYTLIETGNEQYRSGVIAKNIGLKHAHNELIIINDPEVIHISPCIVEMKKRLQNANVFLVPGTLYYGTQEGQRKEEGSKMEHSQAPFVGAVRKESLMNVGGWDERFIYWGNDDNDLMHRLGQTDCHHKVDDDLVIFHQWHPRPPQNALGNYNEPFLYEENKPIVANKWKEWGAMQGTRYEGNV